MNCNIIYKLISKQKVHTKYPLQMHINATTFIINIFKLTAIFHVLVIK